MSTSYTRSSETTTELMKALLAAQEEFPTLVKSELNPHFKSRYADLANVVDTVVPILRKHEIIVFQLPDVVYFDGGNQAAYLVSRLEHVSGQWIESRYPLRANDLNNPQQLGSAMTYARRYTLMAIVGIAPDDDDGETASGRGRAAERAEKKEPTATRTRSTARAATTTEAAVDPNLATAPQQGKVNRLLKKKYGIDTSLEEVTRKLREWSNDSKLDPRTLTKAKISAWIAYLESLPDLAPASASPQY